METPPQEGGCFLFFFKKIHSVPCLRCPFLLSWSYQAKPEMKRGNKQSCCCWLHDVSLGVVLGSDKKNNESL